jgi:hypothetical protein
MKSVPITTKVVSSNSAHGEVYSIQHYVFFIFFKTGETLNGKDNARLHRSKRSVSKKRGVRVMMFNVTFNNSLAMSLRSVLLVLGTVVFLHQ